VTAPRSELVYFLVIAAASATLVGLVRRVVIAQGVIDHPTDRSSHVIPTPRGGGLGAVVAILAAFAMLADRQRVATLLASIGCAGVALIGWLDDRHGLPVRLRLLIHVIAGGLIGILSLQNRAACALALVIFVWWTFWTVSSINVVNFMDGINGLVASQVAIFAVSLMVFGWQIGQASWYATAVAAACIGFLPWNFPHARIFLGDVGSGALGFLVPVLALFTLRERPVDIVQAHLPLLPLFTDGAITIVRRWRRGEPLTEAHRSHLYQRLANGWMGHAPVTGLYAGAAVVGALIAHVEGAPQRWLAILLYVGALGVLAALLEWRLVLRAR
jgi:UDP-N-acetylmuramyl pentapeptide phosphotransferase/UDP-N-acetylglucosamine-1-phosphate transferase